jgi:acid phosphatase type 7
MIQSHATSTRRLRGLIAAATLLVILALGAPAVWGDAPVAPANQVHTLTLQNGLNGYAGCDDTFITTFAENSNFGNQATMQLRAKHEENLLVQFDLSQLEALPAESTIDVAVLSLWCIDQTNNSPIEVNSYRLLKIWRETEATWNQARAGVNWGQPGAFQIDVDRAALTSNTGVLDATDMWLHLDWTFLVRRWFANPSLNHGAVISGTGWAYVTYTFVSSESATQAIRPRLTITYTTPAGLPVRARLPLLTK